MLPKSDHRFADPNNWYDYPNVVHLFSWGNIIRIAKVQNINDRNELYLYIGEELQNIQEKLCEYYASIKWNIISSYVQVWWKINSKAA